MINDNENKMVAFKKKKIIMNKNEKKKKKFKTSEIEL